MVYRIESKTDHQIAQPDDCLNKTRFHLTSNPAVIVPINRRFYLQLYG